MRYSNPIIPGFYPDPSICRVGDDYYLVTSTFEYFPGVPIFHSRDLVNWRQIGHCLTRASQLPLEKIGSSGGIYAPTLRHHDGKFYMVTTNVNEGKHFYVTADDPAGEWSEPIWITQSGIDSSLFFDDDARVYFQWTQQNAIFQAEIEIQTGALLGEPQPIWNGTGGRYPEAPHTYKINGLYYLLIAEGGTEYGHMITIARSDSVWGPFEVCPRNPILTHRNYASSPIQGTGHGDLVETQDGRWWIVFLAFRCTQYQNAHHLGRETFLAPVTWDADGWPVVNGTGTVELEMEVEGTAVQDTLNAPIRDDFDGDVLNLYWNFLRNPRAADWSLSERRGWLRLHGSAVTLNDSDSPAFVGRRQQHFACVATTQLDFSPQQETDEAGLCVIMNEKHHYEICVTMREGHRCVIVRRRIGDLVAIVAEEEIEEGLIELEIQADAQQYTFACRVDGQSTRELATGMTRYLSSEVAGGFTGVYIGLYATGNGQAASAAADFDWFAYQPR